MAFKPLNRRTVLRGLLGTGAAITVPLPLLDAMLNDNGTALAATGAPISPLYVTWFFGNGSLPGSWKPASTGSGAAWQLTPQLAPLAEVKSHLTVISGLQGALVVGGVEHPTGSAAATVGTPLNGNSVRGRSIDQIVAEMIAGDSPFKSIEVGVTPATPGGPQDSLHTVSHRGPAARNNPEFEPQRVFDRLFKDYSPPMEGDPAAEEAAKLARVKKSVLDAVLEDGAALQQRLGMNDRQRLEAHLEGIREIEGRLQTMPPNGGSTVPAECGDLMRPTVGADTRSEAPRAVNTVMAQLTTLALACERTRVATFMFSLPAAHVYYRHLSDGSLNMNDDFHDTICHGDAGDHASQPRVERGVIYAMECLNEFLVNLKNIQHGDGSLLDATLVYVTSDTAWGKNHGKDEWPVLLAGKAGGRLRGDEHHNFPGQNLSRALLTVAQIMGSTEQEFGLDAGHVTAALPGIAI